MQTNTAGIREHYRQPAHNSEPPVLRFPLNRAHPSPSYRFTSRKKDRGLRGNRGRATEGGRLRRRWSPSPPPTPSPPHVCCVRPSSSCSCISGKPPPFSFLTSTPSRSQTAREKGLQERPLLPAGAASPASTSPSFPQIRLRRPQSPPPAAPDLPDWNPNPNLLLGFSRDLHTNKRIVLLLWPIEGM